MIENKLQIILKLKQELADFPRNGKAYECLKIMCDDSIDTLESNNDAEVTFTRWKLKAKYCGIKVANETDPKELQKWIDDKKMNILLRRIIEAEHQPFHALGYIPIIKTNETKGGKGNEKLYWLDIKEQEIEHFDETVISEYDKSDALIKKQFVTYHRSAPSMIKISWLYQIFFKKGEMRNRSLSGIFLIFVIFLSLVFWLLYMIVIALILDPLGKNFTSFNLIILLLVIFSTWLLWKYRFIPIMNLPEHRVIKAPSNFLAFSELDAEIEMFRDNEKNQITRFTRFTATCPICTAGIVLRDGKPDQNAPLVGRCVESPFSHVYSFDRITMKGKYLGD